MKSIFATTALWVLLSASGLFAQSASNNLDQLPGNWKLDMIPQDSTDSNFAVMEITFIDENSLSGTFYSEGVTFRYL